MCRLGSAAKGREEIADLVADGGFARVVERGGDLLAENRAVALAEPPDGLLNRRLTLEAPVENADGAGGVTRSFSAIATLWASVTPVSAERAFEAARLGARITHRIGIRFSDDISGTHFATSSTGGPGGMGPKYFAIHSFALAGSKSPLMQSVALFGV